MDMKKGHGSARVFKIQPRPGRLLQCVCVCVCRIWARANQWQWVCCINKKALRRVMLLSGFLGLWIITSFATTRYYTIEPRRKRRPVSTKTFHSLFKCWSCGFLYCNQITGEESPFGAAAGRPWWLAAVKWSLLYYKVRLIFAKPGRAMRLIQTTSLVATST